MSSAPVVIRALRVNFAGKSHGISNKFATCYSVDITDSTSFDPISIPLMSMD